MYMSRDSNIQEVVMKALMGAGLISLALVAPNALKLLKSVISSKQREYKKSYINNRVIKNLKQKGLITFENTSKGTFVKLTSKGESVVEKLKYGSLQIKKQKRWDKKWRVIMFDIKENRRKTRDLFRRQLQGLGFIQIQKSVWVYPYPCDSVVKLLKADLAVGKDILYMTVETLENDGWLRKEFGLG